MTKGLTDTDVSELLRIPLALVFRARHGFAIDGPGVAIGMAVLSDGLWHPIEDAVRAFVAGRYDRVQVEQQISAIAYANEAPLREVVSAAAKAEDARHEAQAVVAREENAKRQAKRDREEAAYQAASAGNAPRRM